MFCHSVKLYDSAHSTGTNSFHSLQIIVATGLLGTSGTKVSSTLPDCISQDKVGTESFCSTPAVRTWTIGVEGVLSRFAIKKNNKPVISNHRATRGRRVCITIQYEN